MLECRVGWIHLDLSEQRRDRLFLGQSIAQFLLDQVANHALGLSPQHIERIRLNVTISSRLQCQ